LQVEAVAEQLGIQAISFTIWWQVLRVSSVAGCALSNLTGPICDTSSISDIAVQAATFKPKILTQHFCPPHHIATSANHEVSFHQVRTNSSTEVLPVSQWPQPKLSSSHFGSWCVNHPMTGGAFGADIRPACFGCAPRGSSS
jgi:hypothetical protein